jgi:hypothetical protein
MEFYQLMVTVCAGVITLLTLFEKLGWTARVRKADADFTEMRKMIVTIEEVSSLQQEFLVLQKDQNTALLAVLRNELYQSFKLNRDVEVWTDDECFVQTKLHQAYKALHGNGEEEIWWEKKKNWRIVSNEEYKEILSQYYGC